MLSRDSVSGMTPILRLLCDSEMSVNSDKSPWIVSCFGFTFTPIMDQILNNPGDYAAKTLGLSLDTDL